jgi:hypothetical protein
MEGNVTRLGFKTRSDLIWIVNVHRIGETVVGFPHLFFQVPPIRLIRRLISTKWADSATLARPVFAAERLFGKRTLLARRLALATRGRWRHLLE